MAPPPAYLRLSGLSDASSTMLKTGEGPHRVAVGCGRRRKDQRDRTKRWPRRTHAPGQPPGATTPKTPLLGKRAARGRRWTRGTDHLAPRHAARQAWAASARRPRVRFASLLRRCRFSPSFGVMRGTPAPRRRARPRSERTRRSLTDCSPGCAGTRLWTPKLSMPQMEPSQQTCTGSSARREEHGTPSP